MLSNLVKQSQAWGSQSHIPSFFKFVGDNLFCLRSGGLFRVENKDQPHLVRVQIDLRRKGALSREEELLAERMRTSSDQISSLDFHEASNKFFVSGYGTIFTLDPTNDHATEIPASSAQARLHTVLSRDGKRMGFVRNRNIFLTNVENGKEVQVSNVNGTTVMAGEADFIHQEEFSLFRTYHFAPGVHNSTYRIFFLEMDESEVAVYNIANLDDLKGSVDPFRYALTGTKNATIKVRLATVKAGADGDTVDSLVTLEDVLPPWTEYVARCGWIDDVNAFVVAVNRHQNRAALLRVNTETRQAATLYEEKSDNSWIATFEHMLAPLHVFANGSILIASEKSGFSHLYLVGSAGNVRAITAGEWSVEVVRRHSDSELTVWVDEDRSTVYFKGRRDGPLEAHLYAASLSEAADPNVCVRLTDSGFSHFCSVGKNVFVDLKSSLTHAPDLQFFRLVFDKAGSLPRAEHVGKALEIRGIDMESPFAFSAPRLFTIQSNGFDLHGVTYFPPKYDPSQKYPTVIYTYGGPSVQLVENTYTLTRGVRCSRWQLLASLGFVVSVLDNRGSAGRGLKFQRELYKKMGTVELEDQVRHVEYLVGAGITDPKRVAIYGASYGGYMSLIALCKRPDVFRICYAYAPVTSWEAYDTAYTERFMGMPEENPKGYREASVLANANGFPAEADRVVILHGGSDENVHFAHSAMLCQKLCELEKMYTLQVYPMMRHGVTGTHSALAMIHHLQKHL